MRKRISIRYVLLGAALVLTLEGLAFVTLVGLGWMPFEASAKPSPLETAIARRALDSGVRRRALHLRNPYPATAANLQQGMVIYKVGCAGCHGLPEDADNIYGRSFYPPAPQFAKDPPRRSEGELYYLLNHGIRMTGMAAWGNLMEEEQMWKVSAFLARLDSLPQEVEAGWKQRKEE